MTYGNHIYVERQIPETFLYGDKHHQLIVQGWILSTILNLIRYLSDSIYNVCMYINSIIVIY